MTGEDARTPRNRHARAGFTLLELLIVIGLMGLLAAIFMPKNAFHFPYRLERSARVLGAELEGVQQRAIATGTTHRFVIDLDRQVYRIESLTEEPGDGESDVDRDRTGIPTHADLLELAPPRRALRYQPLAADRAGDWHWELGDDVFLEKVRVAELEEDAGELAITFAPDGGTDPARIWMSDVDESVLELELVAFTGEVRIFESEE